MKATHIVFDLETTGLDPVVNEAIQVAAVLLDDNLVEVAHFVSLMRPLRPETANPEALAIHGYTLDHLAQQADPAPVWADLVDHLRDHSAGPLRYVGQNCGFDLKFLAAAEEVFGFRIPRLPIEIDTVHLCRIHLEAKGHTLNSKLGTVADHYKIPHKAHDALGDVQATAEILRRIKAEDPDLVATAYNRPVYEWLLEMQQDTGFSRSVKDWYRTKGFLSPKQITALVRGLPRSEPAPAKAPPPPIAVSTDPAPCCCGGRVCGDPECDGIPF